MDRQLRMGTRRSARRLIGGRHVSEAAAFWSARGGVRRFIALTTGSILAPAVVTLAGRLPASAQTEQTDLNEIFKQFEQHRQAGRYPDAERIGKQAVEVCEKRFGRDNFQCAWCLNNLAIVYQAQGKYAEAEGFYKRALAIKEKALGANHTDVAAPLNDLANVYQAQGKYAEAEGLYKRALAINEKALGANHPDVGRTLNNLAIVYQAQGKYAEAEGLYKRALATWHCECSSCITTLL
jgi:tetratricopeptide (TPR) repeat protein